MAKLEIQFKEAFELSVAGFDGEANFMTIPAPTGRVADIMGRLEEQLSFAATNQLKNLSSIMSNDVMEGAQEKAEELKAEKTVEKKTPEDEEELAMTEVKQLGLGNANMSKIYSLLQEFLMKVGAKFNDEQPVTKVLWFDIPLSEIRRILGYVIVNFANTSE